MNRRDFDAGESQLTRLFESADVVVHVAGATRAPTRAGLHESNVALTARVIDAARRARAGRFVFISSHAAAGAGSSGATSQSRKAPEAAPIEAYGRSKLDAERNLQSTTGFAVRDSSPSLSVWSGRSRLSRDVSPGAARSGHSSRKSRTMAFNRARR